MLVLTCTHNLFFEQKEEKHHNFSSENFIFYSHEILQYIAYRCVMVMDVQRFTILHQFSMSRPKYDCGCSIYIQTYTGNDLAIKFDRRVTVIVYICKQV